MEKSSSNRGQLFLRNKYTVFTMGVTVALMSPTLTFYDRRASDLQLPSLHTIWIYRIVSMKHITYGSQLIAIHSLFITYVNVNIFHINAN